MHMICSTRCALNSHRAKTFAVKNKSFCYLTHEFLFHVYLQRVNSHIARAKPKFSKMNIFDTIFVSRCLQMRLNRNVGVKLMPSLQNAYFRWKFSIKLFISTVFIHYESIVSLYAFDDDSELWWWRFYSSCCVTFFVCMRVYICHLRYYERWIHWLSNLRLKCKGKRILCAYIEDYGKHTCTFLHLYTT